MEMAWTAVSQRGGLVFGHPLDVSGGSLHLRVAVDPTRGNARLALVAHDTAGHTSRVPLRTLPALLDGSDVLGKRWGQDLSVPAAAFDPALDVAHIVQIDLVSRNARGRVWVLDVAAGGTGLVTVPNLRVPRLTLTSVRLREGDGPGTAYAEVPFHIDGRVTTPTTFAVVTEDFLTFRTLHPRRVEVPAGVHDGVVKVPYRPNRRDSPRARILAMSMYPVTGAMPTTYHARATILDDDPAPRVRFRAVRTPIHEGRAARWTLTLSRPVDYFQVAEVDLVPGPKRTDGLRAADVPRAWLEHHLHRDVRPGRLLSSLPLELSQAFEPGERQVSIVVPTRADRRTEGREHLSLRVHLSHLHVTRSSTIGVLDR